jgi:hypothetical protein
MPLVVGNDCVASKSHMIFPAAIFETLRMLFFRVEEEAVSSSSEIGSCICLIPLKRIIGDPLQVHFVLNGLCFPSCDDFIEEREHLLSY